LIKNHDTDAKLGNLKILLPYCQFGFSSKIGMPQLGSARNLHSSARLEPENSSSGSSLLIIHILHPSQKKRKSYYNFGRILETSIDMIGNFVPAHYLENILDLIKIS
jgi:hypothetical protein